MKNKDVPMVLRPWAQCLGGLENGIRYEKTK